VTVTLTNLNDQFSYVARIACETAVNGMSVNPERLPLQNPPLSFDRSTVSWNGYPLQLDGAADLFALSATNRGRVERIDLVLTAELPDSDGDGLPDWWETQYFPGGNAESGNDSDGDGLTDGREYAAGTDPLDPGSVFEILSIANGAQGTTLQWSSMVGKTYSVFRSPVLIGSAEDYELLVSGVPATPPLNSWDDTNNASGAVQFYRIQVEE
jgi:hypothetical protein